jgi:hypothetical protein
MVSQSVRLKLTDEDQRLISVLMKRHDIKTKAGVIRAAIQAYAKHMGVAVPQGAKKKRLPAEP